MIVGSSSEDYSDVIGRLLVRAYEIHKRVLAKGGGGLEGIRDAAMLHAAVARPFVTFGGAYAVLSYIADVGVANGWLSMQQMLMGLGLAESTPGPLIMVTQYVGFLGAYQLPAGLNPLTAGILGALITTFVTFLPCFFFIFAGAPFIEAMAGNQRIQAALTGVTAAVVGVILNLAVWFGHNVLLPNATLDLFAATAAIVSLLLLQKFHFPIQYLVPLGAAAGVLYRVVGW